MWPRRWRTFVLLFFFLFFRMNHDVRGGVGISVAMKGQCDQKHLKTDSAST
jgi:hypothetical protein